MLITITEVVIIIHTQEHLNLDVFLLTNIMVIVKEYEQCIYKSRSYNFNKVQSFFKTRN